MSRHRYATIIGGEDCAGMRLWEKPLSDNYFTCPVSSNKKIITSKVNLDRCQYKVCRYLSAYPHKRNETQGRVPGGRPRIRGLRTKDC